MIDVAHDELIALPDVAKKLDRCYSTVWKWVTSGRLEAVKLGGTWYTTPEALNSFAVEPERVSVPPQPARAEKDYGMSRAEAEAIVRRTAVNYRV